MDTKERIFEALVNVIKGIIGNEAISSFIASHFAIFLLVVFVIAFALSYIALNKLGIEGFTILLASAAAAAVVVILLLYFTVKAMAGQLDDVDMITFIFELLL